MSNSQTQTPPFRLALIASLILANTTVLALEKPQTMEEMWKIIQAQQKQLDDMQAKLKETQTPTNTASTAASSKSDVKTLERKTDVLSQEVEKLRTNLTIPDEVKYKSAYGLGPAASKVYQVGKGLSIGGYGEANYQARVGDKGEDTDNIDFERLVLYTGYKFTDNILFNSELEFEHASTGEGGEEEGEVSVEFAALDFFINPMVNARAGLVLMPMGFVNQIHEPPFFFGNNRPEVERRIIPSTWREAGLGLFGELLPNLTYTAYVVGGLDAAEFSSDGIREGRGGGSQAKAENFGYVARMDYAPPALPGVTFGGSAYLGNAGQNQSYAGVKSDVFTQLYEAHLQWKYRGLEFRTLGSWGHINDADLLSKQKGETIGSENYGWYAEVGYDVLPLIFKDTTQYLAPFFRYERMDTIAQAPEGFDDDNTQDRQIYQVGLQYKPIPNVVIKADYRNFVAKQGFLADDFNIGLGFIF